MENKILSMLEKEFKIMNSSNHYIQEYQDAYSKIIEDVKVLISESPKKIIKNKTKNKTKARRKYRNIIKFYQDQILLDGLMIYIKPDIIVSQYLIDNKKDNIFNFEAFIEGFNYNKKHVVNI